MSGEGEPPAVPEQQPLDPMLGLSRRLESIGASGLARCIERRADELAKTLVLAYGLLDAYEDDKS